MKKCRDSQWDWRQTSCAVRTRVLNYISLCSHERSFKKIRREKKIATKKVSISFLLHSSLAETRLYLPKNVDSVRYVMAPLQHIFKRGKLGDQEGRCRKRRDNGLLCTTLQEMLSVFLKRKIQTNFHLISCLWKVSAYRNIQKKISIQMF